jgi:hypothetical protein
MGYLRTCAAAAAIIMAFSLACLGEEETGVVLKPNGHASLEAGQIVRGYEKHAGDIKDVFTQKILLGFGLEAVLSPQTRFNGDVEVKTFNEFPRIDNLGATRRYYYYLYLTQAELTHTLKFGDNITMNVGGGYFPYKYNDDVKNLGEYLFRSTVYPQTLTTEFDYPFARLAGLYLRNSYSDNVNKANLDILLTTATEWMAVGDINLSILAKYNFDRFFEIGAGVSFSSLISVDKNSTTPSDPNSEYVNGSDTSYYTFAGTKLMARATVDPKKFFSWNIFCEQDLKIYTEAALLGAKNYPAALHSPIWYMSILERIPVMAGINLPTFKLLDNLSVEGEWWGNRYPNSLEGVVHDGLPIPFQAGSMPVVDSVKYKNDNYTWSVFGSRTFGKHYRVSFQAASDHMRTFAWDWDRQDWEECLRSPNRWYYVLKFGVLF